MKGKSTSVFSNSAGTNPSLGLEVMLLHLLNSFQLTRTFSLFVLENIVLPNRQGNVYYHRKFLRVPTVDECYVDDVLCAFEANQQWKRDRKVETMILHILKRRWNACVTYYEKSADFTKCEPLLKAYEDAENAWFIKSMSLPS